MAIPDYQIKLTLTDSKKKKSVMTLFSNALTDAAARAQAVAIAPIVQELTGARVSKVELGVNILTDATIPTNGSDVEEKALFTFQDAFGFPVQVSIPAFLESFIVPGTANVDQSDSEVQDFVNAILTGTYVSSHDDDITALRTAVKTWR